MLESAFNSLLSLNSRIAVLRRKAPVASGANFTQDIKISNSNYFRKTEGPSFTTIKGREFVISKACMSGFPFETLTFAVVPTSGTFTLTDGTNESPDINFDDNAAAVQAAIRQIAGFETALVTGDFSSGFKISYVNVGSKELLVMADDSLVGASGIVTTFINEFTLWSPVLKVGDRIEDSEWGHMAIIEIQEMCDLGGLVIAYRVRVE